MRKLVILMTVLALMLVSVPRIAEATHEVLLAGDCATATFEGGAQFAEIHPADGFLINSGPTGVEMGARFPAWRTLTSGGFSGNPSGVTVAIMTGASHDVTFDSPVNSVSMSYASIVPVTLTAFDAGGGVVDSASASATGTSSFALISVSGGNISKVTLTGAQFQTAIDDFEVCRITAIEVPIDIKPRSNRNKIKLEQDDFDDDGCDDDDRLRVAILSTADFDAQTVDPLTVGLGDPNLPGIAMPIRSKIKDVNGDGDKDLLLIFCLSEMVANEALDVNSTELLLNGATSDDRAIFGADSIRVVLDDD